MMKNTAIAVAIASELSETFTPHSASTNETKGSTPIQAATTASYFMGTALGSAVRCGLDIFSKLTNRRGAFNKKDLKEQATARDINGKSS